MPGQAIQAHSKAIWPESSASGAVLDVVRVVLRYDGSDVVFSLVGPEQLAFYTLDGDAVLLDLAPVYLVASGADYVPSLAGPAVAILADDGSGGVELTTDLARAPIADLWYDPGGGLWLMRRGTDRLDAVQIAGNIELY